MANVFNHSLMNFFLITSSHVDNSARCKPYLRGALMRTGARPGLTAKRVTAPHHILIDPWNVVSMKRGSRAGKAVPKHNVGPSLRTKNGFTASEDKRVEN